MRMVHNVHTHCIGHPMRRKAPKCTWVVNMKAGIFLHSHVERNVQHENKILFSERIISKLTGSHNRGAWLYVRIQTTYTTAILLCNFMTNEEVEEFVWWFRMVNACARCAESAQNFALDILLSMYISHFELISSGSHFCMDTGAQNRSANNKTHLLLVVFRCCCWCYWMLLFNISIARTKTTTTKTNEDIYVFQFHITLELQ